MGKGRRCRRYGRRCCAPRSRSARARVRSRRTDAGTSIVPLPAVGASDYHELVQAALKRAVEKRRAPRRLQPDELRQPKVRGEEIAAPPGESLLERIAEPWIEGREI